MPSRTPGRCCLSLDVRKPNLEEVFLKLTGEALRDDPVGRGGGMNLRVVGANLYVKLISFYREKTAMFFTIAFPIILILVFGTIFMSQDNMELSTFACRISTRPTRLQSPSRPSSSTGSSR